MLAPMIIGRSFSGNVLSTQVWHEARQISPVQCGGLHSYRNAIEPFPLGARVEGLECPWGAQVFLADRTTTAAFDYDLWSCHLVSRRPFAGGDVQMLTERRV